jgi:signal transduction histidine kinase
MFKTLSGRLLLTFLAVISVTLFVVGMALFFTTTASRERIRPVLQELATISRNNQNQLRRLQQGDVNVGTVREILAETAESNNIRILIVNPNGTITFDTDTQNSWEGQRVDQDTSLQNFGACAEPGSESFLYRVEGAGRWVMCSHSFRLRDAGGRIVYAQPEPSRVAVFRQSYVQPIFRAGIAAMLLAIILAALIANWVARPLQRMATAAAAIAQGHYEQKLRLEGPEEVQQVAANFNQMAAQVNATRQAQRDFVANVSHDLKTPITSIRGWSRALLDGTAVTPEAQQRAATIINNDAQRMSRMVSQLLDLAKIESGQFELSRTPVDISQVLTDVQSSLRLRAEEKGVYVTVDLQPVSPVWGDYDRLVQIFTNLADNGIMHTDKGGGVHIALQRRGGSEVEVIVQDTGKGIPPEQLVRIFERFYQVDAARTRQSKQTGSGLGLAIVKELVAAHNGRIQARSQVGKGSAFIVQLPISSNQ